MKLSPSLLAPMPVKMRVARSLALLLPLVLAVLPVVVLAQAPPPPPANNLIKNGRFELAVPEDNLWDGVDNDNFLAGDSGMVDLADSGVFMGFTRQVDAILDNGSVNKLQMPISVQVADLNGDGLLDIMTLDCSGIFRVYFNSGTAQEPKFTQAEIVPLYIGRWAWNIGMKLCLADFNRNRAPDLLIGNYFGQLIRIRNTGSPNSPNWPQPISERKRILEDKALVRDSRDNPLMREGVIDTTTKGEAWANLLSPAICDFDNNGSFDVVVGEGSYSANAIHLLINRGSNGAPKFTEDDRKYLAYGDGREQLVPCVVDYNGDGLPDLLVGDRTGCINVYLNKPGWKPGGEFERMEKPVSFGGLTSIGTGPATARCITIAVGDLNGDGLFDIVVGKPNGRIAVSYNIGTKTEPKFGPLMDLKGEDLWKKGTVKRLPAEWTANFGYRQGNLGACVTTVTAKDDPQAEGANGENVLKFSYVPFINKVFRKPAQTLQPLGHMNTYDNFYFSSLHAAVFDDLSNRPTGWLWYSADTSEMYTDSNYAIVRQHIDQEKYRDPNHISQLKPGSYKVSFRVRGNGVQKGRAVFAMVGWLLKDVSKSPKDPKAKENRIREEFQQVIDFPVSSTWNTVTKTFNVRFQNADLNSPDKWTGINSKNEYRAAFDIRAALTPGDGAFYIDDVQVTAQ